MEREVDILIENGLLVTVDSQRRIIQDGAIAIQDNKIEDIGKTNEIKQKYKGIKIINAKNKVVTPGLIDSHLHLTDGPKGFIPDNVTAESSVVDWILWILACLTPEEEYLLSLLVLTEALKTGTTTFFEGGTIKYVESAVKAIKETGIRGNIGRFTADLINEQKEFKQTPDEAIQIYRENFKTYNGQADGRIMIWIHLIGVGTQSPDLLVKAKNLADELKIGLSMHQSQTPEEVDNYIKRYGRRPIEHLAELGVLDKNVRFIHMIDLSDREIELLKEYEVKLVHCPLTCFRLGYGGTDIGKFHKIIGSDITVALGCDGSNCSNTYDLLRAVYVVAGMYKDRYRDVNYVPAETAFEMATINGAKAMLMEDQIGSLEIGKKADVTIFDKRKPEWLPTVNLMNNLVYSADGKSVDTVIVNGKVVVENQKMVTIDEEALYDEIEKIDWGKIITERTGLVSAPRWKLE